MNTTASTSVPFVLTEQSVPEYLSVHSYELGEFDKNKSTIIAKSIQGGNINYAFHASISSPTSPLGESSNVNAKMSEEKKDNKVPSRKTAISCSETKTRNKDSVSSVFVKQAPEYVAIFGPDGLPLTSKRMEQEIAVYNHWKHILGPKTEYLPEIYHFDTKNMITIMEYLDGYTLLDHELVTLSNPMNKTIAAKLGRFMGKTHAATHSSKLTYTEMKQMMNRYDNKAMREIQLEFLLSKCYKEASHEQKLGLDDDEAFMKEVESLKARYSYGSSVVDDNSSLALSSSDDENIELEILMRTNLSVCHGDLHPGSVMVNGGKVKVIDPEFVVYGPPGLDVGCLLAGYVLAVVHHIYSNKGRNENSDVIEDENHVISSVIENMETIWSSYRDEMLRNGISNEMIKQIEEDAVGYAMADVCRTALEFAGCRLWFEFDDIEVKKDARKGALMIVSKCMVNRRDGGMNVLLDQLNNLSKQ